MTVEAALGIASIVTVLVLAAAGLGAALVQVRLVDAAREAARVAAMSGIEEGRRAGSDAGPSGAEIIVSAGETMTAQASAAAPGLPFLVLRAHAAARAEPGSGPHPPPETGTRQ